jgi:hypothetical protein
MYMTVIRLIWPYLLRYASSQAADYLQKRRERRLGLTPEDERPPECPPCPPCPPSEPQAEADDVEAVEIVQDSSANPIWYALSGIMLGCAFSVMLYVLLLKDNTHPQE